MHVTTRDRFDVRFNPRWKNRDPWTDCEVHQDFLPWLAKFHKPSVGCKLDVERRCSPYLSSDWRRIFHHENSRTRIDLCAAVLMKLRTDCARQLSAFVHLSAGVALRRCVAIATASLNHVIYHAPDSALPLVEAFTKTSGRYYFRECIS